MVISLWECENDFWVTFLGASGRLRSNELLSTIYMTALVSLKHCAHFVVLSSRNPPTSTTLQVYSPLIVTLCVDTVFVACSILDTSLWRHFQIHTDIIENNNCNNNKWIYSPRTTSSPFTEPINEIIWADKICNSKFKKYIVKNEWSSQTGTSNRIIHSNQTPIV